MLPRFGQAKTIFNVRVSFFFFSFRIVVNTQSVPDINRQTLPTLFGSSHFEEIMLHTPWVDSSSFPRYERRNSTSNHE